MEFDPIGKKIHSVRVPEPAFNGIKSKLESVIMYQTPNYFGVGDFLLLQETETVLRFFKVKTGREVLCQISDIDNRDYLPVCKCLLKLTNLTHSDFVLRRY